VVAAAERRSSRRTGEPASVEEADLIAAVGTEAAVAGSAEAVAPVEAGAGDDHAYTV